MTDSSHPTHGGGDSDLNGDGVSRGASGRSSVGPDKLGRRLRDLRLSITDRCNFRCVYCMPREIFGPDFQFLSRDEILSFEELHRVAALFVGLGVRKIRITGGEPLIRREMEQLVGMLASIPELEDLAMTTNASLLAQKAQVLKEAGLHRVTVSLDALDPERFQAMSDTSFPVERVLEGIRVAQEVGLDPVRVNMVVKRGANEDQILPMAEYFRGSGVTLRFIEFMDVGTANDWRLDDVVPAREVLELLESRWVMEPLDPRYPGEVATRYRYGDGGGEVGVISSVSRPFCSTCTRARVTARGELFTCLFGSRGHDLRDLLRSGASDSEIQAVVRGIWEGRTDRYSQLRSQATRDLPRVEMFRIGG